MEIPIERDVVLYSFLVIEQSTTGIKRSFSTRSPFGTKKIF